MVLRKRWRISGRMQEQIRMIETNLGSVPCLFLRKQVKNLNLHIRRDGMIVLSVPMRCDQIYADEFVRSKAAWIIKSRETVLKTDENLKVDLPERKECIRILREALDLAYPLAVPLGISYPVLKVRKMKSQWGNCHYVQGYITLNLALAGCPEELRVYVALHELIHFLHPDHGPDFYACMDSLMSDWKVRRARLKGYTSLL